MIKRIKEVIAGLFWSFGFDNPIEIIVNRHLFRRKKALLLKISSTQVLADEIGSDFHVIRDVLFDGMYDQFILQSEKNRARFHYLNLGGNIGLFDLRIRQLVNKPLSGIAIEMNPSAAARLTLNLELNLISSVKVINAAVWNSYGSLEVSVLTRDTGQECFNSKDGWVVPLLPWEHIFALSTEKSILDLIKIDIEGAEEQVVPCISQDDAKKIRFVAVECHGIHRKEIVFSHFNQIGFAMISEQSGEGETNLSFWRNKLI